MAAAAGADAPTGGWPHQHLWRTWCRHETLLRQRLRTRGGALPLRETQDARTRGVFSRAGVGGGGGARRAGGEHRGPGSRGGPGERRGDQGPGTGEDREDRGVQRCNDVFKARARALRIGLYTCTRILIYYNTLSLCLSVSLLSLSLCLQKYKEAGVGWEAPRLHATDVGVRYPVQ